jgi:hypothetical protein
VEKTFWFSRPDGWVINSKMKRIILLEFKRTTDTSETYYEDVKSIGALRGSMHPSWRSKSSGRGAGMGGPLEVLPLIAGERSVREKEWLEPRGHVDVWNQRRGWQKHHLQAGRLTAVRT